MHSNNSFIQPYLFFNGRCAEALDFYRQALGAEVQMAMRYHESPEPPSSDCLPPGFENNIMHCAFRIGTTTVMASDGNSNEPAKFEGFSLSLTVPTEAEANHTFNALLDGGKVMMPLGKTFFSPCFGMLSDRFGVMWMVIVPA